jgi:hypothetical protein
MKGHRLSCAVCVPPRLDHSLLPTANFPPRKTREHCSLKVLVFVRHQEHADRSSFELVCALRIMEKLYVICLAGFSFVDARIQKYAPYISKN